MAAVESTLVPLDPDDTVDNVLAKVRATGAKSVQLLVPPATGALQAPRGFERLRRALEAEQVSLLVFSADEQVVAAARRNNIEIFAIDDGRTKRPPLPPRTRTTQVLPETKLDPKDAAFIDALDQVPARERYANDPDADLYAALDDFSDASQQYDRAGRRGASSDEAFADSLDEWSAVAAGETIAGRAEAPRRYSAGDIDLNDEDLARQRGGRRTTAQRERAATGARRTTAAKRAYDYDDERYPAARRSPLRVLLPLAALALIAAVALIWVLSSRATIVVAPPAAGAGEHPFQGEIIPLDPSGSGSGAAVQAAPVTADAEVTVSGSVQNETLSPSGTAKGEVTIVNTIESAVPLPKDSEFIGQNPKGEEVRFTLDSDVTVPPAQTSTSLAGRSTTYGQINVTVTARSPGSASNVGENSIKQILLPGQQPIVSDSSNFLIRHGPITGGSEAPQRIVTEQDVRNILAQALTELYNSGVLQLRSKIDEGKFSIDATTVAPSPADLSDPQSYDPLVVEPAIGQPVADANNPVFTVKVHARFKALAAPSGKAVITQLQTVAPAYFAQRPDRACKPGEQQGTTIGSIRWDGEKLMIDGAINCGVAGGLTAETLAQVREALRGQPREAAEAGLRTLQQQGLIGEFQLPDKASLPRYDFLLNIAVAQPQQPAQAQPTQGAR